jgi:hypothetical protein
MNDSHTNDSGSRWQILGELELKFETATEEKIQPWLVEVLRPLGLHQDFLSRIQRSARVAAGRVLQTETALKLGHVHLVIYVPKLHGANEKTWGYFEIEKTEGPAEDRAMVAHAIEFYLYREGQEDRDSP